MTSGVYKHHANQGFQKGHDKGNPKKRKQTMLNRYDSLVGNGGFQEGHKINIGRSPWNKNLIKEIDVRLKEMAKKVSLKTKGKKKSLIHCQHISEGRKGMKFSEEHKNNISKVNIGKTLTEKHRGNISEGNLISYKEGRVSWNKGKKWPEQSKRMIKLIISGKIPTSNTKIERKIKKQLEAFGINFIHQYNVNNKFCCDFYISQVNLIIEADGDYWHNTEKGIKRDKAKDAYLEKCGYNLIRIPEHVINMDSFEITDMIGWC